MSQEKQSEVDYTELERMTNEEEGWVEQTENSEPTPEPVAPQTEPVIEKPESTQVVPETPAPVEQSKSAEVKVDDVVAKVSKETPYKTVDDLINGYKSSQSEVTKFIEQVKPFKQLIDDLNQDSGLRQFIEQATQLYRNPSLAQAYVQPQGQPDPRNYDLSTYEGLQQFQQDTIAHAQKAAFETVNQRMSGWEQQQALEKAKLEFRQKYSDANPDDVLKFIQSKGKNWTIEDAYKIMNYDKVKEHAYEQARKEVLEKANQAAKNAPVSSAPADKPSVSPSEMMNHITRYGLASANKKWGEEKVKTAIKQFTEENDF